MTVDRRGASEHATPLPLAEEDVARLSLFVREHINVTGPGTFTSPNPGPIDLASALDCGRPRTLDGKCVDQPLSHMVP